MRPESKTWLMIGAAIIVAVGFETVTVLVWGHPMSWAMLEAPKIVVAAISLVVGVLMGHFWWPARARWKAQDDAVRIFGDPHGGGVTANHDALCRYAEALWRIHRGAE